MKYCCQDMDRNINCKCLEHEFECDCPDCIIMYLPKFDEYSIIIHDGGFSGVEIQYCPWCGKKLPLSTRDLWFDVLEHLGFEEPMDEEIPEEFNDDSWYLSDKYREIIKLVKHKL